MGQNRNVGLGVSSVEWLRQNGGNSLVSEIENEYYTLTAPSKGGPPLHSLPKVGLASAGGEGSQTSVAYRPPNVRPLIHPALPGEGVWKKAASKAGPRPPVLLTTFRSDPEYPQFVAGVAWIDSSRTELAYVPGLAEPPPPLSHRGPAEVPEAARDKVVATFNGGFPLETSNAGLIYRGRVREAMVDGIATVVEYRDGRVDIVKWESGPGAPADVWVREAEPAADHRRRQAQSQPQRRTRMGRDGQQRGQGLALGDRHRQPRQPSLRRRRFPDGRIAGQDPAAGRSGACPRAGHQRRLDQLHQLPPPGRDGTEQPAAGNAATARTLSDPRRTGFLRRLRQTGRPLVRLPSEITPGAAARRAFLADVLIALALTALALVLAAGIGIVGFGALLVLLSLLLWFAVEAVVVRVNRRRGSRR
jgi:hypothetical protein